MSTRKTSSAVSPAAKKGTVSVAPKKTKTTATVGRTSILKLLEKNGKGKIFSITAATKTDPNRKFTGRLSAPGTLSGGKARSTTPNVGSIGMLRMYDMINKGWRTVNLQTVTNLKCGGVTYKVR
jgi:hypothetical protein